MTSRISLVLVLSSVAALPAMVWAQPAAREASKAPREPRIVRIDGRDVRTSMGPAGDLPGGPSVSSLLTGPPPAVIMDGWSARGNLGLVEDYDFTATDTVYLTFFAKLPDTAVGGSAGESFDVVLVPCGTATIPPRVRRVIFIDDVVFPPIGPNPTPHLWFFTIALTPQQLAPVFAPGSDVDWFVAVDFDATDNADTDGNGVPDCGIELRPTRFLQVSSPDVDAIGADVLRLFVNHLPALDVFEPHPPSPAPKAIGASAGEDATTRPWCFQIR
jgi:hypothetical protein